MDYSTYLSECKGKTQLQIQNIAFECLEQISSALAAMELDFNSVAESFYYAALLICHSDSGFDDKEVKFLNDLNRRFSFGKEELTVASATRLLIDYHADITKLVSGLYAVMENVSDSSDLFAMYSSKTNSLTLSEVLVRYFCALISLNGNVTTDETDFLDALIAGSVEVELDDTSYEEDEPTPINQTVSQPPKVVKVGGSLHKTEYYTYFSVGAEILIEGEDVIDLDVKVQLLDSTGFILESYEESINYVEAGVFRFGREYSIDCNPSSFKVICGARHRGELRDEYRTSRVLKCSGMRFAKKSSYSDSYTLACMCENVGFTEGAPEAEIFVTFYDVNDNIIGGARLDGDHLYMNQADRYEATIDCVPVVNKTHMFRWTVDIYSVR